MAITITEEDFPAHIFHNATYTYISTPQVYDPDVVGSTTRGLFATATGAGAKDGTNTPTGASDTPSGTVKIGMKYTTDFMRTMSDAGFGTATDYTGTLATDLTNISINSGVTGYVKDVAIWQEVISDYKMRNMP